MRQKSKSKEKQTFRRRNKNGIGDWESKHPLRKGDMGYWLSNIHKVVWTNWGSEGHICTNARQNDKRYWYHIQQRELEIERRSKANWTSIVFQKFQSKALKKGREEIAKLHREIEPNKERMSIWRWKKERNKTKRSAVFKDKGRNSSCRERQTYSWHIH